MSAKPAAKRTNVMKIISVYSGNDATIAIPRVYIEMCGDYNRAAVLNQILYWSERTKDHAGWFYKSYEEWEGELGLTRYQIKRAVEGDKRSKDNNQALVNLGVETALRKAPNGAPTIHYRIDEAIFMEHLNKAIDSMNSKGSKPQKSNIDNIEKPILNIVANGNETLSQMDIQQSNKSINTESTTENTTKSKEQLSAPEPQTATSSNEWYDAVKEVFDLHGGRNVNMQKMLQGKASDKAHKPYNLDVPMTIPELQEWSRYYRQTVLGGDSSLSMVKSPEKIQSSVLGWREKKSKPVPNMSFTARKQPANLSMLQVVGDQSA